MKLLRNNQGNHKIIEIQILKVNRRGDWEYTEVDGEISPNYRDQNKKRKTTWK
jgi:hypothetical protein